MNIKLFSLTKPESFADCVGDELPLGWEQVLDLNRGVYYVNHVESKYIFIKLGHFKQSIIDRNFPLWICVDFDLRNIFKTAGFPILSFIKKVS